MRYSERLSKYDDDWASAASGKNTARENVPDGKYQVRVEKVEIVESKQGNLMLSWQLEVLGPKHHKRKIWRRSMLENSQGFKYLRQDLAMCGVDVDKLGEIEGKLHQLLDVVLNANVVTKGDFTNVYFDSAVGHRQNGSGGTVDSYGVPLDADGKPAF